MCKFTRIDISALLGEQRTLTLNQSQRIISLLAGNVIVEQTAFSPCEFALLTALLRWYPDYCPDEDILSAYTGKSRDEAQLQVLDALEHERLDILMHQPRNVLARCRVKLRPFGIQVSAQYARGYQLERTREIASVS